MHEGDEIHKTITNHHLLRRDPRISINCLNTHLPRTMYHSSFSLPFSLAVNIYAYFSLTSNNTLLQLIHIHSLILLQLFNSQRYYKMEKMDLCCANFHTRIRSKLDLVCVLVDIRCCGANYFEREILMSVFLDFTGTLRKIQNSENWRAQRINVTLLISVSSFWNCTFVSHA